MHPLADSRSIWYVGVWGEQDDIASWQYDTQDQGVGAVPGYTSRGEVHDCRHLTADQLVALALFGYLGARSPDTDFAEIDPQLQGRVSGVTVRSRSEYRTDADIEVQECIHGGHD